MNRETLAKEWLIANDPRQKSRDANIRSRRRGAHIEPFADPKDELEVASKETYDETRKFRKRGGIRNDHPAHSAPARWLIEQKNFSGDECLLLPRSNTGRPCSVRYNCAKMPASRAMCIIAHGLPENPKLQAIHSCGNGHLSCVNPKHLRWGTAADNLRDRHIHAKANSTAERIAAALADGKN